MPRLHPLLFLAFLGACGTEAPRDSLAARRAARVARAPVTPDTAVFVAKQAGDAVGNMSAVMQLRVVAQDAEVAVQNEAGQEATTGAVGGEASADIPGSRAESTPTPPDSTPGWHATVTIPVLEGERYLVELAPSTPRRDSAAVELTADGVRLSGTHAEMDATAGETSLFEVVVGKRTLTLSPAITRIDIVPTCGTTHLVRSTGRAELYAQYEIVETHEKGDVHIPARADDAQFRAVSFKSWTKGTVRISYLGRELATATRPEACPDR